MNQIAVLITCFNRKEKTIKCLQHLFVPQNYNKIDVFLVDDGCTDGTPEAVRNQFPMVNIIKGDGTLFWNRGMYTAWSKAEKHNYDYYLWLNDDTFIFPESIKMMISSSETLDNKSLIVGASCDPENSDLTTFGADYLGKPVYPNGNLQRCDAFGGNFVLIPRVVYEKCGKLDFHYRHSLGDIDYAKNVTRSGLEIYLAPYHIGTCLNDSKNSKGIDNSKTLKERWKLLHSPLSYSDPREFFYFYKKNETLLSALLHCSSIYLKFLLKIKP